MKNKIFFLILGALILFTSSSCFISFRGRAGRPHHRDRTYVEPLKDGMDRASAVPLKFYDPSVSICNLYNSMAD